MPKKLAELARTASGVTDDSRKVKVGYLFVAVKGLIHDGNDHIYEAIKNGAGVVVTEKDVKVPKSVTLVKVDSAREALGFCASEFYRNPSRKLKVIGVTGTKGKTTTVHIIYHILRTLGKKTGLVSSIAAVIGDREIDTGFHVTNPDAVTLNSFLRDMVDAGCEYAVIEVSSHGIDQKRIAGINFEVGVLTNIAPEHLDYHKTFKEYKKVKMSFLRSARIQIVAPKTATLNILRGDFNNMNALAAIEAVGALGVDKSDAIKTLSSFTLPVGRLEEVENDKGYRIIIDFAHTPGSLHAVLNHLKNEPHKRLISVFGCASERDPAKRSGMARVSSKLSDVSIFTVEDSRYEDVYTIFKPMSRAARRLGKVKNRDFFEIPERGEAIAFALSIAGPGDIVGIYGKGHEKSLAYKGYEHPWSDQAAVKNYLKGDDTVSAVILAAGKGTRMNSQYPKVVHEICGRPMITYTLSNLRSVGLKEIVIVVSYRKNLVIKRVKGAAKIAHQTNPKGGTADAALAGYKVVGDRCKTLMVINGDDSAFYTPDTIAKILKIHKDRQRKLTFVSLMKDNPTGLGRVIRGGNGLITDIIEEKDATEEQRKIKEINDGLYVFDREWFDKNIKNIKKGPQGEYYINELVKMAIDQGDRMATYTLPNDDEWQGINTPEQLDLANKKMKDRLESNK